MHLVCIWLELHRLLFFCLQGWVLEEVPVPLVFLDPLAPGAHQVCTVYVCTYVVVEVGCGEVNGYMWCVQFLVTHHVGLSPVYDYT